MYTLIIPSRENPEALRDTLQSIISDEVFVRTNYEIIVINDGNNPAVSEFIKNEATESSIPLKEIKNPLSKGSYYARNLAIQQAIGDVFIFIDSGIILSNDWFINLESYIEDYDYVAGNILVSQKNKMSLGEKCSALYDFQVEHYLNNYHFGPTAFLAVKKEVFDALGLFRDDIYSGGDNEFGRRVYQAGYKQGFAQEAVAWHEPRNFKQQYYKKIRTLKGIVALHRNFPQLYPNPLAMRSFVSCITGFIGNLVKFKTNRVYRSGKFSFGEYLVVIVNKWAIEFFARVYVLLNRKKAINT